MSTSRFINFKTSIEMYNIQIILNKSIISKTSSRPGPKAAITKSPIPFIKGLHSHYRKSLCSIFPTSKSLLWLVFVHKVTCLIHQIKPFFFLGNQIKLDWDSIK